MLQERDDIVALDAAILMHPRMWEAIGPPRRLHRPAGRLPAPASSASAPTTSRTRACPTQAVDAPGRGPECDLTEAREFNLMFETTIGPGEGGRARPPTCAPRPRRASSSTSRTCCSSRARSRRSASPRSASRSATRSRRATSSSARASSSRWRWSSSCRPPRPPQWFEHWLRASACAGTRDLGIRPDHLRLRAHDADELSHYSSATERRRVPVPDRLVGARGHRQPRRLRPDASTREFSGEKLEYFDQATGERYVPHVIEPAAGADRATLAFLVDAYDEEEVEGEHAHRAAPAPAPRAGQGRRAAAVRKDGQPELAREVYEALRRAHAPPSTTRAARSASATAARTRSARRWRHGRPPDARGPARSRCATATRSSRSASRSTSSPTTRRPAGRALAVAEARSPESAAPPPRPRPPPTPNGHGLGRDGPRVLDVARHARRGRAGGPAGRRSLDGPPGRSMNETSFRIDARSPTRTCTRAGSSGNWRRDRARLQPGPRGLAREVLRRSSARAALWNYAMFFHGEDASPTTSSPYIDAAPREEQKYFLTTQQVDEARHAVFFAPLHARGRRTRATPIAASLATTQPRADLGLRKVFAPPRPDGRRAAQGPLEAQARRGGHALPPHRRGLARPARPALHRGLPRGARPAARLPRGHAQHLARRAAPHRLRRQAAARPQGRGPARCPAAVAEMLREVIPWTTAVFVPPNWDERYIDVLRLHASRRSSRTARARWTPSCARPACRSRSCRAASRWNRPAAARSARGAASRSLRGSILGEKNGPPSRATRSRWRCYFDSIRRGLSDLRRGPRARSRCSGTSATPSPGTCASTTARARSRAGGWSRADITFRCRFEDWVDRPMGRAGPAALLATGRVIPRGKPRALWRARSLLSPLDQRSPPVVLA